MPSLEVFQSLWGMQHKNPNEARRPHREVLEQAKAAGYAGVCLDPDVHQIAELGELAPIYRDLDLGCLVNAFPRKVDDLQPLLAFARDMQSPFVNVIAPIYPMTVEGAVPVIRRWLEMAERINMPIKFETHRDCITNDMFMTLQLLDAIPDMRLSADLSHYCLNREMSAPISAQNQAWIQQLLERSDSFQGRVSSHEQIQIPLHFPQSQKWVAIFKDWWRRGFESWLSRAGADETLIFLCELGPPEYAMTDETGAELSDRIAEADLIRRWVEEIWRDLTDQGTA
ncbi:MAG: sugar phosphate isomerase/epimerase [Pseudomonadota bacterium]